MSCVTTVTLAHIFLTGNSIVTREADSFMADWGRVLLHIPDDVSNRPATGSLTFKSKECYSWIPRSAQREYPQFLPKFQALAEQDEAVTTGELGLTTAEGLKREQFESNITFSKNSCIWLRSWENPLWFIVWEEMSSEVQWWTLWQHYGQSCPSHTPVHVHCFTGGIQDYQKWIQAFQNVVSWFTGTLLHPQKWHLELLKVAAATNLRQMLLEMDAPHGGRHHKWNQQYQAYANSSSVGSYSSQHSPLISRH